MIHFLYGEWFLFSSILATRGGQFQLNKYFHSSVSFYCQLKRLFLLLSLKIALAFGPKFIFIRYIKCILFGFQEEEKGKENRRRACQTPFQNKRELNPVASVHFSSPISMTSFAACPQRCFVSCSLPSPLVSSCLFNLCIQYIFWFVCV